MKITSTGDMSHELASDFRSCPRGGDRIVEIQLLKLASKHGLGVTSFQGSLEAFVEQPFTVMVLAAYGASRAQQWVEHS